MRRERWRAASCRLPDPSVASIFFLSCAPLLPIGAVRFGLNVFWLLAMFARPVLRPRPPQRDVMASSFLDPQKRGGFLLTGGMAA